VEEFPRHAIGDPIEPMWHESQILVQNKKLQCTNEACMGPVKLVSIISPVIWHI